MSCGKKKRRIERRTKQIITGLCSMALHRTPFPRPRPCHSVGFHLYSRHFHLGTPMRQDACSSPKYANFSAFLQHQVGLVRWHVLSFFILKTEFAFHDFANGGNADSQLHCLSNFFQCDIRPVQNQLPHHFQFLCLQRRFPTSQVRLRDNITTLAMSAQQTIYSGFAISICPSNLFDFQPITPRFYYLLPDFHLYHVITCFKGLHDYTIWRY